MKYLLESLIIAPLYLLFWTLPLPLSREICAFLARTLGPHLKVSRVALDNLRHAFPEKSETERGQIMRDCWDNLGRVVGEFPHLTHIIHNAKRFRIENEPVFHKVLAQGKSCIFFTAHMANWEIGYAAFLKHHRHICLIARLHGNPFIEWLLKRHRSKQAITMISRTAKGSRELLGAVKRKEPIGALLDQHSWDGADLPFFGRSARTTTGLARLAARYDLPFLPVQVKRVGKKTQFIIKFTDPILPGAGLSIQESADAMMAEANLRLEEWIRECPSQWLWLHKRWKITASR